MRTHAQRGQSNGNHGKNSKKTTKISTTKKKTMTTTGNRQTLGQKTPLPGRKQWQQITEIQTT